MKYIYVQDINKRNYTLKEILFIYLSHLNSEAHTTTRNNLRTVIETTLDPIQIKYRVPGFTTTIAHMIRSTRVDKAYVNMATYVYKEQYEDKSDTVISVVNHRGRPPPNNKNQGRG